LNHFGLPETIRLAIDAGNDLAMICHRIESLEEAARVVGTLPRPQIDRALERIERFKKDMAAPDPFTEEEFQRRDAEVWQLRVAVLGEEKAASRSPEDGKRSPVEMF